MARSAVRSLDINAETGHQSSSRGDSSGIRYDPTGIVLGAQFTNPQTDLELYFGRSLGFALGIISLMVLFLTGTIPVSTSVSEPISLEDNDPKAPYALPVLYITSLMHVLSTLYCYTRYTWSAQTGYLLGAIGYGGLACLGAWNLFFGGSSRVSARTGEDKRTSGFLFPNANAYDKKADFKSR